MPDLDAQLETYRRTGYLVVPDALSPAQVDAVNHDIDRALATDTSFWIEREEGHVALNVHMLLAYPSMDVTMRPPTLLPLFESILGPDLCAEEHSVRVRRPYDGEPYCNWHRDVHGCPDLNPYPPYRTRYLSVAYYLSDCDGDTHTFSVLPGSGQGDTLPPLEAYDLAQAHHIEGKKAPPFSSTPACTTPATYARARPSAAPYTSTAAAARIRPSATTPSFPNDCGTAPTRKRNATTAAPTRSPVCCRKISEPLLP